MRWLIIMMHVCACVPEMTSEEGAAPPRSLTLRATEYSVGIKDGLSLSVHLSGSSLPVNKLQNQIFLLEDPEKETMHKGELKNALPILMKKTALKNHFKIHAKIPLKASVSYGIYVADEKNEQFILAHVFLAHAGPPKLVSHNLGDQNPARVSHRQILFRFTFDQPLYLTNDDAVAIINIDPNEPSPKIESLTLDLDQKTIWVKLNKEEPLMRAEDKYTFVFNDGIRNQFHEPVEASSIELVAYDDQRDLGEVSPLVVHASGNAAEITWELSHDHRAEFYFRETTHPHFSLLIPQIKSTVLTNDNVKSGLGFREHLFLQGLKSLSTYEYILRSEDLRGQLIVAKGTFATTKDADLRISEIMIDPLTSPGGRQQQSEFIEIVHVGSGPLTLHDLHISLEDSASGQTTHCRIDTSESAIVPQGSYFLIASSDFDKTPYGIDNAVTIFKLKQKTLCGGFSNVKPKVIKLYQGNSGLIDRYNAFLWPPPKGRSIQRHRVMGLDEHANYCYSKPTPGKKNVPCG